MNVDKYLRDFQTELQGRIGAGEAVDSGTYEDWQATLGIAIMELEVLRGPIQGAADVHDGMALMARLLDSAHTDQLPADEVRCLIEPLRVRLGNALEDARQAL